MVVIKLGLIRADRGCPACTRNRKAMIEININELQQARYMGFSCPPVLSQAKSFVDNIINIILKSERRTRARKSDDVITFKSAVGLIVGDLIIGLQTSEAGWFASSIGASYGKGYELPVLAKWMKMFKG